MKEILTTELDWKWNWSTGGTFFRICQGWIISALGLNISQITLGASSHQHNYNGIHSSGCHHDFKTTSPHWTVLKFVIRGLYLLNDKLFSVVSRCPIDLNRVVHTVGSATSTLHLLLPWWNTGLGIPTNETFTECPVYMFGELYNMVQPKRTLEKSSCMI